MSLCLSRTANASNFMKETVKLPMRMQNFMPPKSLLRSVLYQLIKLRNYCLINDSPKLAFIFLEFFIR